MVEEGSELIVDGDAEGTYLIGFARDLGHVDPSLGADAQRDERREGGHQCGQS